MAILSQEPVETVDNEAAVNYPKRNSYQSYLFLKWKRGILFLIAIFLIGQLFSFGVHVAIAKWDVDEFTEEIFGENVANVVRWLGSEGRAWSVFLDESGMKGIVYDAVGVVKEEVEDIIDPFVWYDPRTW
ncbi:MAG: hypothetical protein KAR20_18320 [Candidatus Heimdallarchaeota archaeon]|nr:hypothetical protein [Candidatus Heimdallarchaeota archaeon]